MGELFTLPVLLGIVYSGIRLATPYLYAAIGEMFAQRSGVFNLGVEGIMLMGAYSGFFVAMTTGNLWFGLLAAAGLLMGLMMSFISVTLQAEQGISGIGLHLFGLGLSSLLFKKTMSSVQSISGFQPIKIPVLGDLPYLGEMFFNHNLLVYVAFLIVPIALWVLNYTTLGLKIRAVGQKPEAADSLGVAGIDSSTITIPAGQWYSSAARLVINDAGTATVTASDARTVYQRYLPGTSSATIAQAYLSPVNDKFRRAGFQGVGANDQDVA